MVNSYKLVSSLESIENNLNQLQAALVFAWDAIAKNEFDKTEVQRLLDQTKKIMKNEKASPFRSRYVYYKADAAASVVYTLDLLLGISGYSSTYEFMSNYSSYECANIAIATALFYCKRKSKTNLRGPDFVTEMFNMPPLKIEYARQIRDLSELATGYSPKLVSAIKTRAEKEATLFNGDIPSNELPHSSLRA